MSIAELLVRAPRIDAGVLVLTKDCETIAFFEVNEYGDIVAIGDGAEFLAREGLPHLGHWIEEYCPRALFAEHGSGVIYWAGADSDGGAW